jgi:tetratricopeptide (TPR) repeat protein
VRLQTLAALMAATLAAFCGVLWNDWTYTDDPYYILQNPHVRQGLTPDGMLWALGGTVGGNWHPLTAIAHMTNVSVFGLHPAGHHAVSLLLHALNAALVAWVFLEYTSAWWPSVAVAALFALHPLRVESVAWASELKDVLSGAFFLLTLLAYRRWVERPSLARQAGLLLLAALALTAKPMVVTLPIVLLLLDAWPLGRLKGHARARVLEKWPLFLMAAAVAVITWAVQRQAGAMAPLGSVTPAHRIGNALVSVWRYLGMTARPTRLAIFYPDRPLAPLTIALAAAGLVAVTVLAWRRRREQLYLLVGWLWYVAMLAPVLGLVQVGQQAYADRYTYLPTLGVLVMLTWSVAELVLRRPSLRRAVVAITLVVLAALGLLTARQVSFWRDTRRLYEHALAVTPSNAMAECTLGAALLDQGDVNAAIPHLEAAVRLTPDFAYAQEGLGRALVAAGRPDEAIPHLERSRSSLRSATAHDALGTAYMEVGRLDDAAREFRAALQLDPSNDQALLHLGETLGNQGHYSEAQELLARAAARAPHDADRRRELAMALLLSNRVGEAIAEYERIVQEQPGDVDALTRLAWIRAAHPDPRYRDGGAALRDAQAAQAVSRTPQAPVASALAAAYAELGRFDDAARAAEQALSLAEAAGDRSEQGRYAEQIRSYRARRLLRVVP